MKVRDSSEAHVIIILVDFVRGPSECWVWK